ncbi:MAG: signal peptidase I [Candidatus Pacebacteria bacterium]|nr:signal peptidase I [Candidatus Paceibacterota bacterium]
MSIKAFFLLILELLQVVAIAAIVVIPIRYFVFQPFLVKGASMEPNFHDGDYLIIDELSYRLREPQRGEVVVFHYPFDPSQRFIKRIIGLPGETIEIKDGKIDVADSSGKDVAISEPYIGEAFPLTSADNMKVLLKTNEYFVMGDNRPHSFDSRKWGVLDNKYLIGRVIIRAWPLLDAEYFSEIPYGQSELNQEL